MKLKNKWNGKIYKLINKTENNVTLEREDGTQFSIQNSELKFSYIELK